MRGEEGPIRPFTSANSMRHGWSWNIPLWHRDGTGYVYSSAFCTKEEAEREQIELLGGEAEITEANHLKMRVGKSKRTWVANCVAVGLAGGFIEPLESTGLALVVIALDELCTRLRAGTYSRPASHPRSSQWSSRSGGRGCARAIPQRSNPNSLARVFTCAAVTSTGYLFHVMASPSVAVRCG